MTHEAQGSLREYLRRHHEVILVGAILLVALALRLYQLEQDSFWIDELSQINAARRPWLSVPKAALAHDGSAPLDYLMTHFAYYYIGHSEGALRLPAVLWGVLSVATVYFLGKRMFDKTTGFLAAAILAILPSHVYYSQEVRPYSLPALMILLATFAFYHAVERNTRGAWALYGATLAVGMYSHYYVAVVGVLHGAYLVLMALAKRLPWNRLLPYAIAAGIAGLLFLPWVLADTPVSKQVFRMPRAAVLFSAPFVRDAVNYRFTLTQPLTWFAVFAWAAAAAGTVLAIRENAPAKNNLALLAIVSLAGMFVALALDFLGSHFFPSRHFLPYAPLLVLLGAGAALAIVRAASQRLARRVSANAIAGAAAALLILFAAGTLSGTLSDTFASGKQDWRGIGRYLSQHADPDDALVSRVPFGVEFYAPELKAQVVRMRSVNDIEDAARNHKRVWVIVDWSSGFANILPDVAQWVKTQKPRQIPGFLGMGLYLHSTMLTPEQLEASLKQW